MPMDRSRYPANWEDISKHRREIVAENCCEWVEADGKRCILHNGDLAIGVSGKEYRVVLTVAHLDHDTTNNRPENLRAWCQRHHLRYDAAHHAANAKRTRQRKLQQSALQVYGSESPLFEYISDSHK